MQTNSWQHRLPKALNLKFIAIIVLLVPAISLAGLQQFTYKTAIRYAINHSPSLDATARQVKISEMQYKNTISSFLPSIDFNNTLGTGHGIGSSYNTGSTSTLGINATQTLYDKGDNITKHLQAKVQLASDQLNYKNQRDKLIQTILQDYLNYSKQTKLYHVNQANYKIYQRQYRDAETLYKQGLKSQTDELNFKIGFLNSKNTMLSAKNSLAQAMHRLKQDMGIKHDADIDFSLFDVPAKLINKAHLNSKPLNGRTFYSYQLLQLQQRIGQYNVDIEKHEYWPNLNLQVGGDYGDVGARDGFFGAWNTSKLWSWHSELQLKFNLFDAGSRRRKVHIADEQAWQNNDTLMQTYLAEKKAYQDLLADIKTQQQLFNLNKQLVQGTQENLNLVTQQYRAGTLQYTQLIDAINQTNSAKTGQLSAEYQLAIDAYQYAYYQGDLYAQVF